MFPRELHYILEEGMSDKHNNKVAKEIENSKGWMQVIVQKQTPERLTNRTDTKVSLDFYVSQIATILGAGTFKGLDLKKEGNYWNLENI